MSDDRDTETVAVRLSEEDDADLAEFAVELGADRSEALCRLVRHGLADWRRERALERLEDRSVTLRRAAEVADLSYVEILDLAAEAGVDVGYSVDDLERDRDRL